jgi:hypothetical protein
VVVATKAEATQARARVDWDARIDALLQDWHNRAAAAQHAHYLLADRLRRRNLALGVPTVVFTTVVGTSLFATLTHQDLNRGLRVVIGCVSVLAAVVAALQTFLRFSERAAQHVTAADWYSAIRRDTAQLMALPPAARGPVKPALDAIRSQMNKAGQNAPEIGDSLWLSLCGRFHIDTDDLGPVPEQRAVPRQSSPRRSTRSD